MLFINNLSLYFVAQKEEENLLRRKRFIKRKRDFGFKFYKQKQKQSI